MQMTPAHNSQLQLSASLSGHVQKVSTCAMSSDGRWLASAGVDKKVLIWSVPDKELKCTIDGPEGHTGNITNARFSPDDRLILGTASNDSTVRIWDLTPLAQGTASTIKALQVLRGHKMVVTAVDFCPSIGSKYCVSCDGDGELRLWDFMTGHCEQVIKLVAKPVYSPNQVRYHPQNPNIVAVAIGQVLYMVQINDSKSQHRTISTNHVKHISTLDWAAQGNYLVTASEDQVCVWDTVQPAQWRVLTTHQSPKISSCVFLKSEPRNGAAGTTAGAGQSATTRLAYGDYEKIWIWTFTGNGYMRSVPLADPQAHPGAAVTALACSTSNLDGENAVVLASASAGKDGNLKLWRVLG
ncbi:WD40-repeat-containing domain protein [Gamsiella multidivaricata]|uniref:WD40-repeat-containing domain protein n=1 Tax=Gamsiella multidivaricata TaxID=101098 RepID=UPI00221E51E2|nr:WD40-repeat-containing domain protein [Gamsiella multidivaricata]KAI7824311.1 WD40-repeat-containing domain protein [Gamsiella multidivaricata]